MLFNSCSKLSTMLATLRVIRKSEKVPVVLLQTVWNCFCKSYSLLILYSLLLGSLSALIFWIDCKGYLTSTFAELAFFSICHFSSQSIISGDYVGDLFLQHFAFAPEQDFQNQNILKSESKYFPTWSTATESDNRGIPLAVSSLSGKSMSVQQTTIGPYKTNQLL